ncbi:hypothetical protein M885DRAFT_53528 [Pelagophyceae sp. CCMP2097]|nr:hypothetical protein M885DRAFT_53528 [Pelagophyceae sp. CCMP2097]
MVITARWRAQIPPARMLRPDARDRTCARLPERREPWKTAGGTRMARTLAPRGHVFQTRFQRPRCPGVPRTSGMSPTTRCSRRRLAVTGFRRRGWPRPAVASHPPKKRRRSLCRLPGRVRRPASVASGRFPAP